MVCSSSSMSSPLPRGRLSILSIEKPVSVSLLWVFHIHCLSSPLCHALFFLIAFVDDDTPSVLFRSSLGFTLDFSCFVCEKKKEKKKRNESCKRQSWNSRFSERKHREDRIERENREDRTEQNRNENGKEHRRDIKGKSRRNVRQRKPSINLIVFFQNKLFVVSDHEVSLTTTDSFFDSFLTVLFDSFKF